jgi:serine/threonine-protein kinase
VSDFRDQLQASLGSAYTLERELTGAGMSRVFVADEQALGRKVVVKVLPPDSVAHISTARFKREISLAAQLQHPHIVPLLTAGDADGLPFYTMPYVRGESLRVRLTSGELPLGEAVRVLRQIASALAFAHDAGVVHRDIKPDNVLISGDAAMVTDFGVAKALSAATSGGESGVTSLGMALGTPAYMSPEQASADPSVDHRSDIYAWGVLAYELLTGTTPFAGRTQQAMLAAHTTEPPQPIDLRRPAIPAPLARLVMRCLEKRPADRPQHAREIVQSLDEITTPMTGVMPAKTAESRRRRSRSLIFAAIAVVVLAGAAIAARIAREPEKAALVSAAVLPLEVAGGDTAMLYLAEGLSDGVSAELLRRGVRVAPRTSTYALRDKVRDPKDVASALGVASVFVGRVRPRGSRIRVTYDLVGSDGTALTQGALERDAGDAIAIQDEILQDLLRVLRPGGRLAADPSTVHQRAVNPQAYDLYLRAVHHRNTFTKEGIEKGIDLFKRAIAIDSTFASAYAEMAWAYMALADAYYPPRVVVPPAQAALRKALSLDDSLAAAHRNLAALYQQYLFDWDGTRREANRALALNPSDGEAYLWLAASKLTHGERAGVAEDVAASIRLDPLSPFISLSAIWFYTVLGHPDSAIARYHRMLELDPEFFYLDSWVSQAFRMKGRLDSALAAGQAASRKLGHASPELIITLVALGRREEARRQLAELEAFSERSYVPPELLARAELALGDTTKALANLEKGPDAQSAMVQMVTWYPEFRELLGNPRFDRYLRRVNLYDAMRRLR